METSTLNRQAWLLNLLFNEGPMTFKEIGTRWIASGMGEGRPLAKRTFHHYVDRIAVTFGAVIECDKRNRCRYYVSNPDALRSDSTKQWLLKSFSLSNMVVVGHHLKGRIIFEEIARGTEYLQDIVAAMNESRLLLVDYAPFGQSRTTYHIHPYALKVYNRRWYLLGYLCEQDALRHIALDRLIELQKTDQRFEMPADFNAERFYADYVGVFVNSELSPQSVKLRVYGSQVDYFRTLPLHHTQHESYCKHGQFSDFTYRLCFTPDLTTQLLSLGEAVEVLEPAELRETLRQRLLLALQRYNNEEEK